jgi:hypothetical protein
VLDEQHPVVDLTDASGVVLEAGPSSRIVTAGADVRTTIRARYL